MSDRILLGNTPLEPVVRPRTSEEYRRLYEIRDEQNALFTEIHEVCEYEEELGPKHKGLWPARAARAVIVYFGWSSGSQTGPEDDPLKSFVTRYRHDSVPHNAVMSGWVERERGSRYASVFTQVLENVGRWLPAGEPKLRAQTREHGRVALEGFSAEQFEDYSVDYQGRVVQGVRGMVSFIAARHDELADEPPSESLEIEPFS